MKRFLFYTVYFIFTIASLFLVSGDVANAQRRTQQNNTKPTRPTQSRTADTISETTPEPEPAQEIVDEVSPSVPASSGRGVVLEFIPSELVSKQKNWAVLVGVNDYVKLANLNYCVNDIKAIETSLLQTDFQKDRVFCLVSGAEEKDLPTRNNIIQVIQLVCRSAGPDDFVFIALNGHGIQIGEVQYFCPSDMDDQEERLEETAISIDWIYKALETSAAKFKSLVVDACRDNPFKGRRSAFVADIGIARDPPKGIALLRSCDVDEISIEDANFQKGIFTHFFLEGLTGVADMNGDGKVSFLELYMYTQEKTQTYALRNHRSQQNPYIKGEFSDFPFVSSFAEASVIPRQQAASQQVDVQSEVMVEMLAELRRLREARNATDREEQERRIRELEEQIAQTQSKPKQIVQTVQQPRSQPVSRAEAVKMVNQHNLVSPVKITGAMRQELIQQVQQQGRMPGGLQQTLPNRQQQRLKENYR